MNRSNCWLLAAAVLLLAGSGLADEPPAINPFAPRPKSPPDAVPGCLHTSDGEQHPGQIYLTRDTRLQIYDGEVERQRQVPLRVIQRIDCAIAKEWMEKEWRFKENANDEKVYTGRTYPAREYTHTITLKDGRKISGPLSGVVYVQPEGENEARKFILHKRDKGPVETALKSLIYVSRIELGYAAMRATEDKATADKATPDRDP